MINLKFLNKAVELTDANEFRVLYVIANTLSLKKEGHTLIFRDMLAYKLNLSTKQITRLTNSLVEKGILKKDLVYNDGKSVCYYSLNLDIIDHKSTSEVDKNVPLNKSEKDEIKEKKENKMKKDEKIESEFDLACGIKQKESSDFFEDFKKKVDSKLVGENEDELLDSKVRISSELSRKRMEIGSSVHSRCSSYLNRKYEEAIASV